jgi:hypothetical protein
MSRRLPWAKRPAAGGAANAPSPATLPPSAYGCLGPAASSVVATQSAIAPGIAPGIADLRMRKERGANALNEYRRPDLHLTDATSGKDQEQKLPVTRFTGPGTYLRDYCRTKIKKAGSCKRNRPLTLVGDTGIEPVTSSV